MEQGELESVTSEENVFAVTKMKEMQNQTKMLERNLGRKTEEVEILKEAVLIAHEKKTNFEETIARSGGFRIKHTAEVLEVSLSNLMRKLSNSDNANIEKYTQKESALNKRIRANCDERPGYGYHRVSAFLNRKLRNYGIATVNCKKVYRIMLEPNLLLKRFGPKPTRTHDGKIVTLTSDVRYASDIFHLSCWNGDLVRVAFVIDCCNREIIAAYASRNGLTGEEVWNLILKSVESGSEGIKKLSKSFQWLSASGPQYTSRQKVEFGRELDFRVCTLPSYCPESNGLADGFKYDYIYVSKLPDGATVARQVIEWLWDYNENAPNKGSNMRSPR